MSVPHQLSLDFESISEATARESSPKLAPKLGGALLALEEIPGSMDLALMATELKLSHAFDKLSALSNSRTRLLPHQIESTYVVVNSLNPRFILADEVGLGKTIEASLVMKELIFRRGYKKVLIVAPSPLLVQWQQELKNKFNEDFEIIKRKNFQTNGSLYWKNFKHVLTSIDFIKNPKYADEILKTKWDIVIFDEAHRLRRDYSKITRGYVFAERISRRCECLLLLTATPFRGKLEELYYLMHLIDPNILGPYHSFVNDYVIGGKTDLKEKISKVLLRRRKVEVGGFTKRFAKTVRIELSPIERQFYDETTEYVKREYNMAMGAKNRAVGFVMIVFQKLLDSSVIALISALTKRKFMLETKVHYMQSMGVSLDDWDMDETENVEEFINELEEASPERDLAHMRQELFTLNRLLHLGKQIKEDRKSIKLKETLIKLKKEGHKKFIIFTQFRTTQDYLYQILTDFDVVLFHGSLTSDQKEQAIQDFKNRAEVLICTEAGGEGRNLQFSNILFNYDLPWSPLKIEQRIGRIHRFGQKDNVYIFNFASKDTVAERILEVLTNKIRLFEESIGASDDLLGTIEEELDFNSTLMHFVTGQKTKEEMESELDLRIQTAKKGFDKLNALVTPRLIDFNLKDYYDHTLEERKYTNNHLESFIFRYLKIFPDNTKYKIKTKENAGDGIFTIISPEGKEKLGTFDADLALANDSLDFVAFGHPLVNHCIEEILESQVGERTKILTDTVFQDTVFYAYHLHFKFSLKRTEILFLKHDLKTNHVSHIEDFPTELKEISFKIQSSADMELLDALDWKASLQKARTLAESIAEARKEKLILDTDQIFKKEEYKIQLSHQKQIRQLEEKLQRQEANLKWEGKPERKSAVNRTKNEILKAREELDREIRKIRSGANIHHSVDLFQVYICK